MADKTILELTDIGTLNSGDAIPIARPGTTSDNKTTISGINSFVKSGADTTPTQNSGNLITSGGVKSAIGDIAFSTNEKVGDTGIETTPTTDSTKLVTSGGIKTAIDNVAFSTNEKVSSTGIETTPTTDSTKLVTSGGIKTALGNVAFSTNEKVNQTGIDSNPTTNSTNLVQSGGVKNAIDGVAFSTNEKVNAVGIDSTPTLNSTNLVQSGGVKTELNGKLGVGEVNTVSAATLTASPGDVDKTYICGTLTSLTINGTSTPKDTVLSIEFTSGTTATTLTYNTSEVTFIGGVTPYIEPGSKYLIAIWYNTGVCTLLN